MCSPGPVFVATMNQVNLRNKVYCFHIGITFKCSYLFQQRPSGFLYTHIIESAEAADIMPDVYEV